jgi:hypothetical protein
MLVTRPPDAAVRKTRVFEILRGVAIAIQLLLLALLIVGRAFGAVGDSHFSHMAAPSVVPRQHLSAAN